MMDNEKNAAHDREEETAQYALDVVEEDMMKDDEEEDEEDIEADEKDGEMEEDENEDEEDSTLTFQDGVNPLDLVEDGVFTDQLFQKFVGMDYEALAEKKRKALVENRTEGLAKKARQDDLSGATMEEIMEAMNFGMQRRSRKRKKKGRRKGSRNKLSPEITKLIGDATYHYALGSYEEAIPILNEVIKKAPLPDAYHMLGLVHHALGNEIKALNFYTLAALSAPRNSSLWELLFEWFNTRGITPRAIYCLSRAITADPKNINLKYCRASLYVKVGDYRRAALSYEQILQSCPDDVEALRTGAYMYKQCGQLDRSVHILKEYLKGHPTEPDLSVVDLLTSLLMQNDAHKEAIEHIEHAQLVFCSEKELPLEMKIREGICHAYLGNMEKAEILFSALEQNNADHADLITKVADSFMSLKHYSSALKYYLMLNGTSAMKSGFLHIRIARCHLSLNDRGQAILCFYKALETLENNIDARLTLASILHEEDRDEDAILLLSPPENVDCSDLQTDKSEPWWCNGKVKLKLCHIYRAKGMPKEFVNIIYPLLHEALCVEAHQQKVRVKRRLTKSVLLERIKVLDDHQRDNLVCGSISVTPASDMSRANRARKLLEKQAKLKEENRANALAAGVDWQSDDSDEDPPEEIHKESPLPELLKNKENYDLIIYLCKSLASLHRYREALEIINLSLKVTRNISSFAEELRSLGAQIAYNTPDPEHGLECVKYIADQHPHSYAAWNCYYKVITRFDDWYTRHFKFLRGKRDKLKDCTPPIIICGHHYTRKSRHQDAAREYLEAYKLLPENAFVNLCVGTALINLALGLRLQNKHQSVAQGLAFLYNNLRLCEKSQEALYNLARAFHHVGLVTLAAVYYQHVLAIHQKDCPLPRLPHENSDSTEDLLPGYCDLRREAAFNLHLIYKKSGAVDLARTVLKDHCSF